MNRPVLLVVVLAALIGAVAFGALTLIGGDDAPEFGKGSYEEIEQAMTDAGLDVQDSEGFGSEADAIGGYEQAVYDVFSPKGDGLVVVRAFSGPQQLGEINDDSYLGDAVVGYRWQQFLITITGASDPDAMDLLRKGMDELGAVEVFDLR